ncbi:MAG TPA: hypothetical protein VGQ30_05805, partial [Gemmatimonadaceae bacterium]|nr:hypothetical protein [Gemmatimonadaceae bacterium]
MTAKRRRAITTPGERGDPARRGPASAIGSLVLHVLAIAVLVRVAIVPFSWIDFAGRPAKPEETHVDYVRTAADTGSKKKSGGDNRPVTSVPAAAPIVPPSTIPSELPPEPPKPAAPVAAPAGGSGPVIGTGGPTRGITPEFNDARIWAPSDPAYVAPKTKTEKLDSAIATRIHHLQDSLRALGTQRAEGDWSWNGKDGKKYGIDQKYIHLGNFSIPTALLALLPLNVQGNPSAFENARRFNATRAEIIQQEARSVRDEEFNQAVKDLRARAQKERAAKAKEDATIPDA